MKNGKGKERKKFANFPEDANIHLFVCLLNLFFILSPPLSLSFCFNFVISYKCVYVYHSFDYLRYKKKEKLRVMVVNQEWINKFTINKLFADCRRRRRRGRQRQRQEDKRIFFFFVTTSFSL